MCFRGEVWRKSIQAQIEGDETTEFDVCFELHQIIPKSVFRIGLFKFSQPKPAEKKRCFCPA